MTKLDYSKSINEMNIKIETKGILGIICRNWWWNEEEKQEYERLVREKEIKNQQELRKKYNPEDIFKNRHKEAIEETKEQENVTTMVEYKDSMLTKFVSFF